MSRIIYRCFEAPSDKKTEAGESKDLLYRGVLFAPVKRTPLTVKNLKSKRVYRGVLSS